MENKSFNDYLLGAGHFPPEKETENPEHKAETAIMELRNRYSEQVREQYESEAEKLRAERDAALRENWILQQKAEAALPEQLAAAGINGGASETAAAGLMAQYQESRNDIRSDYLDELGDLSSGRAEKIADAEKDYNEMWLDYLLSIAKKEHGND